MNSPRNIPLPVAESEARGWVGLMTDYCTYPKCKCVVSTSTSQPEPVCPKGLEPEPVKVEEPQK